MSETTGRATARAREMLEELERTRDEVRLQLHLAGMEVKDAYHALEPQLTRFESKVHAIGDEPVHELEESFFHLREAFRKLRGNGSS